MVWLFLLSSLWSNFHPSQPLCQVRQRVEHNTFTCLVEYFISIRKQGRGTTELLICMRSRICFLYTYMWLTLESSSVWASALRTTSPTNLTTPMHHRWLGHFLTYGLCYSLFQEWQLTLSSIFQGEYREYEQLAITWRPGVKTDSASWVPHQAAEGQEMMTSSGQLCPQQRNCSS